MAHVHTRALPDAPDWVPQDGEACRMAVPSLRLDAPAGTTEWVINTTQQDRHGTIIPADALALDNYTLNPVVFLNHASWDLPIGRSVVSMEGTGDAARLVARMRDGDASTGEGDWDLGSDRASDTYRLVKSGILRAASIGFVGRWKRELIDPEGSPYDWENIRLTLAEGELLEWSPVGVPSNPGALVTARQFTAGRGGSGGPAGLVVPEPRVVVTVDGDALARALGREATDGHPSAPTPALPPDARARLVASITAGIVAGLSTDA